MKKQIYKSIAGVLLFPSFALADCDKTGDTIQLMQNNLNSLINIEKTSLLYNFQARDCSRITESASDLGVSVFLPLNETSQGLFNIYRQEGEDKISALIKTYQKLISFSENKTFAAVE